MINVVIPFISQKTDFKLSVEESFDQELLRKQVPSQIIFSSSASEVDHKFARTYKEYAIKMMAGDKNYAVFDIPCDVPLSPMVDSKPAPPLLEQGEIDDMLKLNYDKAMREYFNKFQKEGGAEQMIKLSQVRKAETFVRPTLFSNDKDEKFIIAMDSALQSDNSIIMVMQLLYDDKRGYYGKIVNCINLKDTEKKKNIQMNSKDQMEALKQTILNYNIDSKDYERIDRLLVDVGHAGMQVFLDLMLSDWYDDEGVKRKGFIDSSHPRWEGEKRNHPNAWDNVDAVSPSKHKKSMCEDLFELIRLSLIELPQEYDHKGHVFDEVQDEVKRIELTAEEERALINIDILKTEMTSIHKMGTRDNPKYELPKNKVRRMHDDRFYCLIMLAKRLAEVRRNDELSKSRTKKKFNLSSAQSCTTAVSL